MIRLRGINNPKRVSLDFLKSLCQTDAPGSRLAQEKWDGWRRPAYKIDGKWVFQSKSGGEEARKPLPPDLAAELAGLFPDSDNLALDMEWIGPRNKDAIKDRFGANYNGFRVFDLLYLNGLWLGDAPFSQRFQNLKTILTLAKAKHDAPHIELVKTVDTGWDKFYEECARDPLLEGVVVKKASSKLVQDGDNPQWVKVKYRDIHEATAF